MAIFVLFSKYFTKSQSVTAVTIRVVTAASNDVTTRVATAPTILRIKTTMVKTKQLKKGGHQGNRNSGSQG